MLHAYATDTVLAEPRALKSARMHRMLDDEPIRIYLVEDKYSDAMLTRHALDCTDIPYTLQRFQRGNDVLAALGNVGPANDEPMPDAILLDLGLPDTDGFEVLAELSHQSPLIRSIPIIVVTAFKHFEYIQKSYPLCVAGYLQKPCSSEDMHKLLKNVRSHKEGNAGYKS